MSNQDTVAKNKLKYENTIFKTNMCGDCIVVEYRGAKDVTVRFEDTGFETTVAMYSLQKGEVKDRLKPSFYGVGVVGEAFVKNDPMYNTWMCMLNRCYGAIKTRKNSTYKDCTMSDNFRYYPYFKDWCEKQVGFDQDGWQLDKDILGDGTIYSEDVCVFVPQELNSFFKKKGGLTMIDCIHSVFESEIRTNKLMSIIDQHKDNLDQRVLKMFDHNERMELFN